MAFKILGQKQLKESTDLEQIYSPTGNGAVISSLNLTEIFEKDSYVNIYLVKSGEGVQDLKTQLFNRLKVSALETKSILAGITMATGDKLFVEIVDAPSNIVTIPRSSSARLVLAKNTEGIVAGYVDIYNYVNFVTMATDDLSTVKTYKSKGMSTTGALYIDKDGEFFSYVDTVEGLVVNSFKTPSLENEVNGGTAPQTLMYNSQLVRLNLTEFVIGFRDAANSNYGTLLHGTIAADGSISYGTKQVFYSNTLNNYDFSMCKISETKFAITYTTANHLDYKVQVINVVGTAFVIGDAINTTISSSSSYVKYYGDICYIGGNTLAIVHGTSTDNSSYGYGITISPMTFADTTLTRGTIYQVATTSDGSYNTTKHIEAYDNSDETAGEGWGMLCYNRLAESSRPYFVKFFTDGLTVTNVSNHLVPYETVVRTGSTYATIIPFKNWMGCVAYVDDVMGINCVDKDGNEGGYAEVYNRPQQHLAVSPMRVLGNDIMKNWGLLKSRYGGENYTSNNYGSKFVEIDDVTGELLQSIDTYWGVSSGNDHGHGLNEDGFHNGEQSLLIDRYGSLFAYMPGYIRKDKVISTDTTIIAAAVQSIDYQFKAVFYSEGTALKARVLNMYSQTLNTEQTLVAEGAKMIDIQMVSATKFLLIWRTSANALKSAVIDWDGVSAFTIGSVTEIASVITGYGISKYDTDNIMVSFVESGQVSMQKVGYSETVIVLGTKYQFIENLAEDTAIVCHTGNIVDLTVGRGASVLTYRFQYKPTLDTFVRITTPFAMTIDGDEIQAIGGTTEVYVANNGSDVKVAKSDFYDKKSVTVQVYGDEV